MDEKQRSGPQDITSRQYEKVLPTGVWLQFPHLPLDTTDDQFQIFLESCGLYIDLDRISVRNFNDGSCAVASIPEEMLTLLVNWVIDGKKLGDREVIAHRRWCRNWVKGAK